MVFKEELHLGHKVALIESDDLIDGSVTSEKLSDGCITSEKIADGAITKEKFSEGAIDEIDGLTASVYQALQDASDAEAGRESAFNLAQTDRAGRYNDAEAERNRLYALAEDTRIGTFNRKEKARDMAFNEGQQDRVETYIRTEGEFGTSTAGDGSRWGAYKSAEAQRWQAFDNAESWRDGILQNAVVSAEKVDANLEGYNLVVTNREGTTKSVDARGTSISGFIKTGETFTETLYDVVFSDGSTQEVTIPKGEKGDFGQIPSDWNQSDRYALDYIRNKPTNFAFLDASDGSATTTDFDPQTDTVWHIPQSLSLGAKAQARANIGAQALLTAGAGIDITNNVISTDYSVLPISQSDYNSLQTKDPHTLYIITS